MAGVHGLQHVQGFLGAHLADDDAVGTHAEGVDDKLANVNGAHALHVGGARFHARHVGLLEPQFGRVFDGHDALVLGDVGRQRVEQGGLAGAGSAADEDIEPRSNAALEQLQHAGGHAPFGHQVLALQGGAAEAADAKQRAVHGDRRDGGIDARTVRKPGIHQGRRFVHAAAHA